MHDSVMIFVELCMGKIKGKMYYSFHKACFIAPQTVLHCTAKSDLFIQQSALCSAMKHILCGQ